MPDFDKSLLALIGVSSGAYASLKIPEDKGAAATSADAADDSDGSDDDSSDDSES